MIHAVEMVELLLFLQLALGLLLDVERFVELVEVDHVGLGRVGESLLSDG